MIFVDKKSKLKKIDFVFLIVITFFYACLSFYRLGSFSNPNTFVTDTDVLFMLDEVQEISKIRYFTGHKIENVKVSVSTDGKSYTYLEPIRDVFVFSWNDMRVEKQVKYIRLEIEKESYIGEIALYNSYDEMISLQTKNKQFQKLIDEQNTIPKEISYFNSTYFDEVYFARTAYEYANGLRAYEWVHPPLGKLLISFPIFLFQMAPFYYRLMGNIAGILMIPILYIFAKRMFQKTKYAVLASLFIAMDGFHFAHTRMATVDSFLVLFVLLSFLFMYEYFLLKDASFLSKIIRLFCSSLFMSLAICVKWTGCFAAFALAILFFIHFFRNYLQNKQVKVEGKKILGFCILFFVFLPILLYIAFYLCFPNMEYYQTRNIKEIFGITSHMYDYHSTLKEVHPFYSSFYTWPFMLKPVWYYVKVIGVTKSTISGFGNPILWWFSTISLVYLFYKCFKKDKNALFLFIIYLCMFLPYFRINRGMFLYHYFPLLPFTFLSLVYLIVAITEKVKNNYFYFFVLVLVCFFFFYFFPVVSGVKIEVEDLEQRKWISSWHF